MLILTVTHDDGITFEVNGVKIYIKLSDSSRLEFANLAIDAPREVVIVRDKAGERRKSWANERYSSTG